MIAHSANGLGKEQSLQEHLQGTAMLCAKFLARLGFENCGYLLGCIHDIGKASTAFQQYIRQVPNTAAKGPDHSSASAVWLVPKNNRLASLGLVTLSHHRGLVALSDFKRLIQQKGADSNIKNALQQFVWENKLLSLLPLASNELERFEQKYINDVDKAILSSELLLRLLFSCLVDADYLDTEAHFSPETVNLRRHYHNKITITSLWEKLEQNQKRIDENVERTPINRLRQEIYAQAVQAAAGEMGIYRLTVPTGGGKTRTSMAFALRHALLHNLERVIMAVPYTSIIEQNADVYRQIFGKEAVLEHHSSFVLDGDDEDSQQAIYYRLAAENWDAPIIVTTTVQLFASLFSNRPSACRRLHNIAKSVIILDEVQSLPQKYLLPILNVLQTLVDDWQVTVVLCTATQPALEKNNWLDGLENVHDIIPSPGRYYEIMQRVEYHVLAAPLTWQQLAEKVCEHHQVLVVVNTKKDALKLVDLLRHYGKKVFHLSTLLCGEHRRDVLAKVKAALKAYQECILVSTQVIEAGVDLDFPVLYRAMGPLDRIVQAAGRCNREGRLTDETGCNVKGKVFIFTPVDGRLPAGEYSTATQITAAILNSESCDLSDPRLFNLYFERLRYDCAQDAEGIQNLRNQFNFPEVAKRFHLIDDVNNVAVAVRYGQGTEVIERLTDKIKFGHQPIVSREDYRKLQPYIVNITRNDLQTLINQGLVTRWLEGVWLFTGKYDEVKGLTQEGFLPEELIF